MCRGVLCHLHEAGCQLSAVVYSVSYMRQLGGCLPGDDLCQLLKTDLQMYSGGVYTASYLYKGRMAVF
jgi:hypothetical protein